MELNIFAIPGFCPSDVIVSEGIGGLKLKNKN